MTDPRPVYTAHDVVDLLNSLPVFFGFRPHESLVAVATHGPRRRIGFRMRADMPAAKHVVALAEMTVAHLRNNHADGAIVLALTEHQDVARDLLAAVEARLGAIVPVVVARADGRRYWVDDVPDEPAGGTPYETSDHHVSIVQAIAAGQQILPDREALVARYAPVREPLRRRLQHAAAVEAGRVAGLVERLDDRPDNREADPAALVVTALAELQPMVVAAGRGGTVDDHAATVFSVWVGLAPVRRAIWSQITPETAEDLHRLLVQVSARVVPPFEPAVLSLAAFAAWLGGNGTEALIAVERALRADPHDEMALLLMDLIEHGVPPTSWPMVEDLRRTG